MKKHKIGLAAVIAVCLSLVMASSAMAAPPISKSGSQYIPVNVNVNVNDQPPEFAVTDVATDPDGDETITLASAGYPCDGQFPDDDTHVKVIVEPWDVAGDQKTCLITVTDGDSYANVYVNITLTDGDTTDPVVVITSPADGTTFTTNTTNITYTVSDNEDSSPTCDVVDGASVNLTEGANALTVNCIDDAGNTGSDTVNVTYEVPVVESCTVRISLGNVQVSEGDENHQIYVPVTLSNPCATSVTLSYSTQAKTADGSDYVGVTNQSITIPAGATTASIPITILGDDSRESSEIFFVLAFSDIEGATLSKDKATVVIQNDDKS